MVQVFIDVGCGSELCTDSYPMAPAFEDPAFEKIAFECKARMVTKGGEDFGIACNADEDAGEGAEAEGADGASEKVIDIVDAFQLQSLSADKAFFKGYVASYVKKVLLAAVPAEELENFKANIQNLIKKMLSEFENADIYQAEKASSVDEPEKCMPVYAYYHGEEEAPRFVFFKHGIKTERY